MDFFFSGLLTASRFAAAFMASQIAVACKNAQH
jgi:hypothetical protein